eukprot:scaffold296172_cov33-Prasinocladus_malaysianus.AAC.1
MDGFLNHAAIIWCQYNNCVPTNNRIRAFDRHTVIVHMCFAKLSHACPQAVSHGIEIVSLHDSKYFRQDS